MEDLELLSMLRDRRRDLIEGIAGGRISLRSVRSESWPPFVSDTRVVKLLERHPALGKVAARRLIERCGCRADVSIGEISSEAWASILREAEASGAR